MRFDLCEMEPGHERRRLRNEHEVGLSADDAPSLESEIEQEQPGLWLVFETERKLVDLRATDDVNPLRFVRERLVFVATAIYFLHQIGALSMGGLIAYVRNPCVLRARSAAQGRAQFFLLKPRKLLLPAALSCGACP